jgi:hypothetical protein
MYFLEVLGAMSDVLVGFSGVLVGFSVILEVLVRF